MAAGVQVTLNFNSMDEAILALGKLAVGAAPIKAAVATGKSGAEIPVPATSTATKPGRKPRNDAGKPRGSYKEPAAPDVLATSVAPAPTPAAPVAADPKAAAPETAGARQSDKVGSGAASADPTPAAAAPVKPISDEQIQSAIQALWDAKGAATTLAVFSRFGVKVGRELKPEQRADFIAKALAVIEGETV